MNTEQEKRFFEALEGLEKRISRLEKGEKQSQTGERRGGHPDHLRDGEFEYAGKFTSADGSTGSTFGANGIKIASLLDCNSFEMAKVIDAFSSEERIDIVKELAKERCTAKELMEKLKFATTGKLYHHLSYLEKIGAIQKDNDKFHLNARYISCIVLIFVGVQSLIGKNQTH